MRVSDLATPCLLLDPGRLQRNAQRMLDRSSSLGVGLRPHLKTTKCDQIARIAGGGERGPITVSTVREAECFAEVGYRDILYGVCVTPDKLDRIANLTARGIAVHLIVDSREAVRAIIRHPGTHSVLIEVDCGEHRTGVAWDSAVLMELADLLHRGPRTTLMGVMTHAGHSYRCRSLAEVQAIAARERQAVVNASRRLANDALPCPIVSVGSTPTATHVDHLEGVTEMRPGVYLLGDLFQAGIQSCSTDDLAASVLTTVLSHQRTRGRLYIDAGGLALSKDRSTSGSDFDAGYGRLASPSGELLDDLTVASVHQEHGEVHVKDDSLFEHYPIGSRLRVFPNHICMTAAMYDRYHLLAAGGRIEASWSRLNGWHPHVPG